MATVNFNGLDSLVHGPFRLGIMTALYADGPQSFTSLFKRFEGADGSLSMHLRKLETAGYIACKRGFVGRRPKSIYSITATGRKALRQYLATMQQVIDQASGKPA